jgi:hypothetical protein
VLCEEDGCPFLEMISGTYDFLEAWDLARAGLTKQSTADEFDRDAQKLEKAGLADKAEAARDMARKIRGRTAAEPALGTKTLPKSEAASGQPQKPLVHLTKRLILTENGGKKGVCNEQAFL